MVPMAVLFHYSHDAAEFGPFSASRMRELAAAPIRAKGEGSENRRSWRMFPLPF
jgi:hypothetical protein